MNFKENGQGPGQMALGLNSALTLAIHRRARIAGITVLLEAKKKKSKSFT